MTDQYIDLISDQETQDLSESDFDDCDFQVGNQDWENSGGDFTKKYNRTKTVIQAASNYQPTILPASNNFIPSTSLLQNSKLDSSLVHLSKQYSQALNLNPLTGTSTRKGGNERVLIKDKSDRATNQQVLDDRTRLILFKMLGRELISKVEGCISTGKEANVYHALVGSLLSETHPELKHLAVKIYKTSILVFKDRDRYVTGEFRFKNGYARSNPRKMVRLWAEKELRNLRRLKSAGIRCPDAIEVRENVLVMSFLGQSESGWEASPRLKDAELPQDSLETLYQEALCNVRTIYKQCKLVHADLSEYNIIYHDQHLYIIDVSQSVEQDHPHAYDFLKADITNVDEFFSRRGVKTVGLQRTFNFVVSTESYSRTGPETEIDLLREIEHIRSLPQVNDNDDASVFKQSFIPRTMNEVIDPERDADIVQSGQADQLIYADSMGIKKAAVVLSKEDSTNDTDTDTDTDSESESEPGSLEDDEHGARQPKGKKFEDKQVKKERKQAVKDEKAEKRKTKMPKSEKKRRIAKTSGKRR